MVGELAKVLVGRWGGGVGKKLRKGTDLLLFETGLAGLEVTVKGQASL